MCLGLEKQNYKPFASAQGKSSGHSVLVGEEMMNHLAMYDFKITSKTLALTRIALAATILTSKKSQDGISKLIYKSDLDKMKGKDTTCRLDDMLNAMWPEARKIDKDVGYIAFGRASVHMILHLLGKEKLAKKETFESFTEIVEAFHQELQIGPPSLAQPGLPADASASSAAEPAVKDLINCSNKDIAMLQNEHIKVGGKYLRSRLC